MEALRQSASTPFEVRTGSRSGLPARVRHSVVVGDVEGVGDAAEAGGGVLINRPSPGRVEQRNVEVLDDPTLVLVGDLVDRPGVCHVRQPPQGR